MGVGGQLHVPAALPPGKRPGVPGPVWTGAEDFPSTGMRTPERPARSESLYRLLYLGPLVNGYLDKFSWKQQLTGGGNI